MKSLIPKSLCGNLRHQRWLKQAPPDCGLPHHSACTCGESLGDHVLHVGRVTLNVFHVGLIGKYISSFFSSSTSNTWETIKSDL